MRWSRGAAQRKIPDEERAHRSVAGSKATLSAAVKISLSRTLEAESVTTPSQLDDRLGGVLACCRCCCCLTASPAMARDSTMWMSGRRLPDLMLLATSPVCPGETVHEILARIIRAHLLGSWPPTSFGLAFLRPECFRDNLGRRHDLDLWTQIIMSFGQDSRVLDSTLLRPGTLLANHSPTCSCRPKGVCVGALPFFLSLFAINRISARLRISQDCNLRPRGWALVGHVPFSVISATDVGNTGHLVASS